MKAAYLIRCITNLHVGTGMTNYGMIDNMVQRDSITGVPVINSSSLKGALREYFSQQWGGSDDKLLYIFGNPPNSNNTNSTRGIGHYKFFNASLLSIPVRSNIKPYYDAISELTIDEINDKSKSLGINYEIKGNFSVEQPTIKRGNGVKLEAWIPKVDSNISSINSLSSNCAVFDVDNFKKLTKRLPVIARNQLENGESKNLWYEEIIPRQSHFIFFVSGTNKYAEEFNKAIEKDAIQIGANGSIGYGFSKITKLTN